MFSLEIIIWIVVVHFVADYLLQTEWMGVNKSSSLTALGSHIAIYTVVLMLAIDPVWGLFNGIVHGVIDYGSSRWSKRLWVNKEYSSFFTVLGFDQLLHLMILFVSYKWLVL